MGIRTTITIEEDVMASLKDASKRRGTSFKETVNAIIRVGLLHEQRKVIPPFKIKPLDLGVPLPGINYDCSAELQAMEDEERYRDLA